MALVVPVSYPSYRQMKGFGAQGNQYLSIPTQITRGEELLSKVSIVKNA